MCFVFCAWFFVLGALSVVSGFDVKLKTKNKEQRTKYKEPKPRTIQKSKL
jgi:hypothetical protein